MSEQPTRFDNETRLRAEVAYLQKACSERDAADEIEYLRKQLVKSAATIERLRDDLRRILLTDKEQ